MSLLEVLPLIRALSRIDKFRLMQELIAALAQEEGLEEVQYPVGSLHNAHEVTVTMMQLLDEDKVRVNGVKGSSLIASLGTIPGEDLKQMKAAIEADCE